MASNELALRFTEETYATKAEVSKELKMSLIDNIWSNILNYRSNFNKYLSIRSIEKNQLVICFCPSISASLNALQSKLFKGYKDYSRLSLVNGDQAYFQTASIIKALDALKREYDLSVDDFYLRNLVNGDAKEISGENRILYRYQKSLDFVAKNFKREIDIDYLADLYSVFTENHELTSFYRTQEDNNPENKILIDRIYTCAPVHLIDQMMNSLFDFINNSPINSLCKAIATYYYVNYVRPFPLHSDEIALLLAKSVLAHYDFDEYAAYLPLETLLYQDANLIAKISVDVQRTNDLTYFINYMVKFMEKSYEEVNDILVRRDVNAIRKDFYRLDEEPAVEIKEEVKPAPIPEPVKIVEREVIIEPAPAPAPKVAEKVVTEVKEEIAVSYIPPVLDEKQAARLEEHLLELDPSLKRGQAKFYARHCTMGKRYTIQQYKKAIGCAYETARTSMDHLVELGYYRKEAVKNKYVYTPMKQK